MTLKNKKVLIIIGGGIAAYKSLDLIRLLKKNDMEVKLFLRKVEENLLHLCLYQLLLSQKHLRICSIVKQKQR